MWLHIPPTFLASAPVSECTTLDSEQCSMLERSATSSGKHSPRRSWSLSWKRDAWMRRLSGLTLPPSTLEHGAASWISSLQGSPASPTPSPASAKATRTGARSGKVTDPSRTSCASSGSVAPPWSSSRTSQLGLLGDGFGQLESNYASWVTSSKARSTSLRTTLAHRINASGSGSWPTSRAEDSESCGNHGEASDSLNAVAAQWQTPDANLFSSRKQVGGTERQDLLVNQTAKWTTPRAQEDGSSSPEVVDVRRRRAREKYDRGEYGDNSGPPSLNSLTIQAATWSTPVASDDGVKVTENSLQPGLIREALTFSRPDLALPRGNGSSKHRLGSRPRLNPAFGCWLMGLMPWWTNPDVTSSVRSAMAEYRCALRSHGQRLLGE